MHARPKPAPAGTLSYLRIRAAAGALLLCALHLSGAAEPLTLAEAERLALADEPGLAARLAEAAALREDAVADGQLPDPELSAAAFNFPVDTFDWNQEPITQLRVGLRQRVPGGAERSTRRALTRSRAAVLDEEAALRVRDVLRAVRLAMIELAWRLDEARELEASVELLEELEQASLAGYRQGRGAQQDVLRARLEQQVLRDRLASNAAALDAARAELARWVGDVARRAEPAVPETGLVAPAGAEALARHPRLRVLEAAAVVADRGVDLARTAYAPDWSVEVTYGARDELPPAGDRPDFLTAAVSVQLPLFRADRQDRRLAAREGEHEAARARHLDALRELDRALAAERAREAELTTRLALHQTELLPLARETVAAARAGLSSDVVDYAEVVRAALAEIDLRLRRDALRWDLARSRVRLAWLTGDARGVAFAEALR
ncbi:MAG: TolC family protein [Pseudomonadales bacterium]|jgi:outer membrane protein TolC|nr:TolC family protein [Pseudomonadales bacterium]